MCLQGVRRENVTFNTLEIIDWKNGMLNRLKKWKGVKKWTCEIIKWIEKLLDTGKDCHKNGGQLTY
jgi:hypothetical protein